MQQFPEVHRWFSSEIIFPTQADVVKCYKQLKVLAKDSGEIQIESGSVGVHFSGSFNFLEFNESIPKVISECMQTPNFSIKYIFSDPDGYFGGGVTCWDGNGEVIDDVCINTFFEREYTDGVHNTRNS